jgi:hypothetical protein
MELIHTTLSNEATIIMFTLVLLSAVANWFEVDMFFIFTTMNRQVVIRLTYIIFLVCAIILLVN